MALKDHVPHWLTQAVKPAYPFYRASQLWSEAGGLRMSAAMSFYGILSLAPLLLVLVGALGWWMDREVLEGRLVSQIAAIVGEKGSALIQDALASAKEPTEGIIATVFGFAVLLFGATGVFTELQDAFERLWAHGRGEPPKLGWRHTASLRLRGVGYVLVFVFLLLISLALSALLSIFSGWAGSWFAVETLLRALNEAVAFAVCAALFTGMMRLSSGPKPRLRYLLVGGVMGATLFTIGRQLMTVYLSTAASVSAYGAAGSLIVMLMWIYFSSAVLLYGAGCARAVEEARAARDEHPASPRPVPAAGRA